jgi:hypothetical protein
MRFLHRLYDKDHCTYAYCLVDKRMTTKVINTAAWYPKTCQVSSL